MVAIGKIFNNIFRSKPAVTQALTTAPKRQTRVFTDAQGQVLKMEREFLNPDGTTKLFRLEPQTLTDGSKKTTMKVFDGKPEGGYYFGQGNEGLSIHRDKVISRQNGESILGGDKITVEKHYHETMGMTEHSENLTKEYGASGNLEHKDLVRKYRHWGAPEHSTQDRVYANSPLNHSVKDMYDVNPNQHTEYKHSINHTNNYHHFTDDGTNYSRAVAEKEKAIIEAQKQAEASQQAAKLASQKAAQELKAKMPRVNTGKILGLNSDELKMVEKVHEDGSVTRYFFYPETGTGKRKPIIKTYDKGILHQEWIGKTPKADMIYMKQVGKDTPYIVAKKGNYTQVGEKQYYNNGEISYINEIGYNIPLSSSYTFGKVRVKMPYQKSPNGLERKEMGYIEDLDTLTYDVSNGRTSKENGIVKEMFETHQKEYINLRDLFQPYKK